MNAKASIIEIDTNIYTLKINSKSRIKFKCGKCKKEDEKTFFFIYNYGGAFCKECTLKDKANSMRENYKIKTGYDNPSQNPEIKKDFGVEVEVYGVKELTADSLISAASRFVPIEEGLLL